MNSSTRILSKGDTQVSHKVPSITFKTRVRDESVEGPNPFRWQDVTSDDIFNGKKKLTSI